MSTDAHHPEPTPSPPRAPKRIKFERYRGWTIGDAMYVGRPTRWGQPPDLRGTNEEIVRQYEEWVLRMSGEERETFLAPLRGRDLACWCEVSQPCHADVRQSLLQVSLETAFQESLDRLGRIGERPPRRPPPITPTSQCNPNAQSSAGIKDGESGTQNTSVGPHDGPSQKS